MPNLLLKASNERDSLVTFSKWMQKEKGLWAVKVVQVNNDLEQPLPYSAYCVHRTISSLAVHVDRYRNKR